ncbi:MAG: hypothetical protein V4629_07470 [Pseudomonadota bacterium]
MRTTLSITTTLVACLIAPVTHAAMIQYSADININDTSSALAVGSSPYRFDFLVNSQYIDEKNYVNSFSDMEYCGFGSGTLGKCGDLYGAATGSYVNLSMDGQNFAVSPIDFEWGFDEQGQITEFSFMGEDASGLFMSVLFNSAEGANQVSFDRQSTGTQMNGQIIQFAQQTSTPDEPSEVEVDANGLPLDHPLQGMKPKPDSANQASGATAEGDTEVSEPATFGLLSSALLVLAGRNVSRRLRSKSSETAAV